MGRRKMSWEELKNRGCKPGRWMARKREQEGPTVEPAFTKRPPPPFSPDPEAVAAYVAAVKREWDTFVDRCDTGETVTREYGTGYDWKDASPDYQTKGAKFNWHPCLLTECRDYAKSIIDDPSKAETWARELSERFIGDLPRPGFFLDVEATKNLERMLATFADPEKFIPKLRLLAMVEFLCWKKPTGANRFPDEDLLSFNEDDIGTMDAAFEAQQTAVQN